PFSFFGVYYSLVNMSSSPEKNNQQSASSLKDIRATRIQKVETLKEEGLNPFAYKWEVTHHAGALQQQYVDLENGEEVETEVSIAGRIIARRVFGKLAFFTLQDETG
ncbi:hypothetical protein R0J92_22120, partial [Tritonibacter sp. SIMBA_163]